MESITHQFLSLLNDQTFLHSISLIDFQRRNIIVKKSFWNVIFSAVLSQSPIVNRNGFVRVLKQQYMKRLSEVSANQLKLWFTSTVKSSFIDFVNVLRYTVEEYSTKTKHYKQDKILRLRQVKHFEHKGKRYYLFQNLKKPITLEANVSSDNNDDSDIEDRSSNPDSYNEVFSPTFGSENSLQEAALEQYNLDSRPKVESDFVFDTEQSIETQEVKILCEYCQMVYCEPNKTKCHSCGGMTSTLNDLVQSTSKTVDSESSVTFHKDSRGNVISSDGIVVDPDIQPSSSFNLQPIIRSYNTFESDNQFDEYLKSVNSEFPDDDDGFGTF